MSIRVCENAHIGFEEFDNIRIFTPEMYLFGDTEFMYQRVYNFVMIVVKSLSLSKYDEIEIYLASFIKNKEEVTYIMKIIHEHTKYFVNICNHEGKNGTTSYVKFLISALYPLFYCVDSQLGSRNLTNYIFGDQIPSGAENIVSLLDLDETIKTVMSSDGCKSRNGIMDILHFRSTFKSYEVKVDVGTEHWIKARF